MKLSRVSVVAVVVVSLLALSGCSTAHPGPKGTTGSHGQAGKTGATGSPGAEGAAGAAGAAGAPGSTGAAGAAGSTGTAGAAGAPGPAGPVGPASVPQYAYVYNQLLQTVEPEGDVLFSGNGDISSGLAHTANSADIDVNVAGEYEVTFSVSAQEGDQFGLTKNGRLVPGSLYGAGSGDEQNTGTVIFSAAAGDVLTLRSFGVSSSIDLAPFAGGSLENSDATLAIHKID